MTDEWRPLWENHAIEVMAAVVTFAEPLPALLRKRLIENSRPTAHDLGLRSEQPVSGLQITVDQTGSQIPGQFQTGVSFNAHVEASPPGSGGPQLVEQFVVDQASAIYRTWRYVSWDWTFGRMKRLLSPLFPVLEAAVAPSAIRLEYLDRFFFSGPPSEATPDLLLRKECKFIAPHVFNQASLWHSHTGAFVSESEGLRSLLQVNIDAVEVNGGPKLQRSIAIMSAREDRFSGDHRPTLSDENVFVCWDGMHTYLKQVLDEVLVHQMSEKILLRAKQGA